MPRLGADGDYAVTIRPQLALKADFLYSCEGFAFLDAHPTECLFSWKLRAKNPVVPQAAPTVILTRPIVSLSQDGYRNYYHWVTEILPKLRFLSQFPADALIALPASSTS